MSKRFLLVVVVVYTFLDAVFVDLLRLSQTTCISFNFDVRVHSCVVHVS